MTPRANLDDAIEWFVNAALDGDLDASAFFRLTPQSQILSLQLVRTALRVAMSVSELDQVAFLASATGAFRSWMDPKGAADDQREHRELS